MKLLAISTSGPVASAALLRDGVLLREALGEPGRTHSETLLPLMERLLREQGLTTGEMDAFGVDVGPGSFTGVRIGVATANALGFAHKKPVVPVSSLRALRENVPEEPLVCALLDARNGNGYAALFGGAAAEAEPRAVAVEEYLAGLPEGVLFIGDGAALHEPLIRARTCAPRFCRAADALTARGVGAAAWEAIHEGGAAARALPLYLRPSQAERMYQKRHGSH